MKGADTTFLIDLLRNDRMAFLKATELDREGEVFTTEANVYELVEGIHHRAPDKERALKDLDILLSRLTVLPLDRKSSLRAGKIAGDLTIAGKPIEDIDCLTAGILLAHGCTSIVTRNTKHFERVEGLSVESY